MHELSLNRFKSSIKQKGYRRASRDGRNLLRVVSCATHSRHLARAHHRTRCPGLLQHYTISIIPNATQFTTLTIPLQSLHSCYPLTVSRFNHRLYYVNYRSYNKRRRCRCVPCSVLTNMRGM